MRFSTLACIALTAATLQPVTSSNVEARIAQTSDESVRSEGDKGWGIWKSLLDKSSEIAGAIHEELDSLSASAHKLYDGLHLADTGGSLWDKVVELGPNLRLNTEGLFRHAMELYPSEKIMEFKASVDSVTSTGATLHQVVLKAADQHGIPHDSMKEELGNIFNAIFEDLKEKFPPPEEAPGHENRTVMINTVLDRIEGSFIQFAIKQGVTEEPLKSHCGSFKFHVQIVITTIGDLVEQHPELATTLLLAAITMVLPELWLLRKVLHMLGFGPQGPIKGGIAAWLQGWLFGPAVPKGGWFALLQRLAMKAVIL